MLMATGRRILIVDDDVIFVKSMQVILESHGYQVDTARDGDEGLAKMSQDRPDLVLLDVMMGWPLEGVSVSQQMMSRWDLRHIPIIMVSSIRASEYRSVFPRGQYLHIHSWVDKPCTPSRLVSEIEETLARADVRGGPATSCG